MDLPGDPIERAFSVESNLRVEGHAGLLSPQGGNALPRLVNRTIEVDEKEWLELHRNSQSELVHDKSETAGRIPKIGKGSTRRLSFWHRGLPIINPYAQAYAWWCAFLLFMDATYTAFVVPIGVGFNTSSIQWNWVGYWDFIAGVTFAVELLLSWSVAYVATRNLRKRIVLRRRKIAQFYIWHGTFIFDLISTLVFIIQCVGYGMGSAGSNTGSIIQIVQILRALRLLRLLKLLQQLFVMSLTAPQRQVPLINKALPVWLSYLGQLAYIVGLFLNFLACLWVFVAKRASMNNTWVNNYSPFVSEYGSSDPTADTLTKAEVDLIPGPVIYLAAAYWSLTAITTIGFGDITPITNAERGVMLLVEILGVLFFGILLGSITSLLQRASQEVKEAQMFREKMGHVTEWMGRSQLPRNVKEKIRCYYSEVWVRQQVVENDLNLFMELPTHLRAQVAWLSNRPIMDNIGVLKDLSPEVQYMITGRARPTKVPPGHEICVQGDVADCIWLLHEGDVVAIYHYKEGEIEKGPAIVGGSALLAATEGQFRVRPCGYRTMTACVLWEVSMQDLQLIVDSHPHAAEMLETRAREHLKESQAQHPHLWGLATSSIQDRSKNNVGRHDEHDEGSYHGDHSEMSEEEGFAGHTFEVKGRAVGRGDTDVDHPSDTLKHYGRHTNSFLKNQRRGSQKGAQQEDAGSVGHDSLLSRITITAPDDNHVVISMPAGNTTKPASHVARSSANSSSADNRADPSDSAYSADALPPPNMGQSHSGGTHEVCLEQWQRQRQPGSQQSTSQSGQDPLQHNRPDLAQQHAGPGDQTAGPGAASNMSSDVHRQQVRSNQTAGGSLESLVPEPLSLHSPQSQNMLQHRNEPHQRQQQQPAPLSRSSADVQLPDQRPPKGESAPDALSAVSVHGTGLHSGPVALSKSQSAHQGPAESLAGVSAPSDQVNSGGGPRLSGGVCCRDQQLDALHEQLQSLVQSSQNINDSLLRVHDQIQFLKSQ
ncbi:hypothetical protein ABBQ32_005763 [Trebouxia sp. C0010 RCD-2024]